MLYSQIKLHTEDQRLLALLWQYLRRTVYDDGLYEGIEQRISLGCPLSPLMGGLFLDVLDRRMVSTGLVYIRFMDDWVILAQTRWKLRNAVRIVNETLAELQVSQHPDKTFVGRIDRRFSFLGDEFKTAGLVGIAQPTRERFAERIRQLYEQKRPRVALVITFDVGGFGLKMVWVKSSRRVAICWSSLPSYKTQANQTNTQECTRLWHR